MQNGKDILRTIVSQRLNGKRSLMPDELGPCADESFLIGAHVDRFRAHLSVADGPFDFSPCTGADTGK